MTPWTTSLQASLSITISRSMPKLMSIEFMMPSNYLILCCPLLLLSSIFPSIRVFSNELVLRIRWPEYWSFSFSISPSNDYSGLISFRMDWFDLLEVQETLKHLLQYHSSKAPVLRCLRKISGFPGGLVVENLPSSAGDTGDTGSIPGLGTSRGIGNGNPLQYSCLENSMDRGAWWAAVHGVTKSQTILECVHTHTHTHTHTSQIFKKYMLKYQNVYSLTFMNV